MNMVSAALKRPITVIILIIGVLLTAGLAVVRMPRDIFPSVNIPVLYVAENYEGMTPEMIESYIAYYLEYYALYVADIKTIEDKVVQGEMLLKMTFHKDVDIAAAMAQTTAYAIRALAFMPQGIFPPFVTHLDAGSIPVGYVEVAYKDSAKKQQPLSLDDLANLQNEAMNRIRPYFATLPGLSSPAPFGASEPTVVAFGDPQKLKSHLLSPLDLALALKHGEAILPPGNVYMGDKYPMLSANYYVDDIQHLKPVPIRLGTTPTVTIGDVAKLSFVSNIQRGYAECGDSRCAYIPVVKVGSASTMAVVKGVKAAIPTFQELVPKDMSVKYVFDQSVYVTRAIKSLVTEGLLEALLVGFVVWLFLRDLKSVFLVCSNIPLALLGAMLLLWAAGQTVNIMTLGGLALSIAILVDQGIVVIENIFTQMGHGKAIPTASLDGATETITPNLLATACIMAVFLPALLMEGVSKALFVPLSLSVGFALLCSFILSSSFVPISAIWMNLKAHHAAHGGFFERLRTGYTLAVSSLVRARSLVVPAYLAAASLGAYWVFVHIGRDIFPPSETSQFRMHLSASPGTSIDATEALTNKVLAVVKKLLGPENVHTIGYVGMQSPDYAANLAYQFSSGPEESLVFVDLDAEKKWDIPSIKEELRGLIAKEVPQMSVSFEPSDMVSQILAQGAPTPIELAVTGTNFSVVRAYAAKFLSQIKGLPGFRDVRYEEPLDYPSVKIHIDRSKAGRLGFSIEAIADAIENYSMSSRYDHRTFWADLAHGVGYMVQTQIDQHLTGTVKKLKDMLIPLHEGSFGGAVPLKTFATVSTGTIVGEYDRVAGEREVIISANLQNLDLGHASEVVKGVVSSLAKERPRGVWVHMRGESPALIDMFDGLKTGLIMAVVVILVLLAAYFQSPALALTVVSTTPAVLLGCGGTLMLTGDTLNIQSYIGIIMSLGIATANSILLCVFAEHARRGGKNAAEAAIEGGSLRLRPILMTAMAMLAGMLPMALGMSESGKQSAPLGRAVFGGLLFATVATLLILPCVYAILMNRAKRQTPSLLVDDPEGAYYNPQAAALQAHGGASR